MKSNEYEFWRQLLLGRGFKEPFFHNYYKTPFFQIGLYVFALSLDQGYCGIGVCEDDLNQKKIPRIFITCRIGEITQEVLIEEKNVENIVQVIDAVVDPELLPLCMGIHWAAPLVEFLFKEVK